MRKQIVLAVAVMAVAAVAVAGCKQKVPQGTTSSHERQNNGQQSGMGEGTNPHAGLKPQEMAGGAVHEGKVASTMNSGGYTYVEVDENGKKLWVAVLSTEVKTGDRVEFPDSPPMENFHSKTLNRTFEKIIFSPVIRVNGKTQTAAVVPEAAKGANPHGGMK